MKRKRFYEDHRNFTLRTNSEYYLSPGIRCKFDLLKKHIGIKRDFQSGIDLGCSGNSFLLLLDNIRNKSFFDIAELPLAQYLGNPFWHPLCGDSINLPYRDNSFDFVSALDVLEHIKNDEIAVSEIGRILRKSGIAIITVPHRMKYYSTQDQIIGHYRRYDINQIITLFKKYRMVNIRIFGVYGQLMRIADVQSTNPSKMEENLIRLRNKYEEDPFFRKIWNFIVDISSKIMKLDARYQPSNKIMNMAFIFMKK